jgi:hypothetical protein
MSMLDFIGTILIVATTVVVINAGISSLAITRVQRLALALAVGVWVGLAAAFASSGLLAVAKPVPYIGAFVALPLLAAAALVAYSPQWRAALIGLPMPLLVGLNIGRLVGVLFLFLAADGRLGGPFPYSAGWGDIIVGTLAVPALWFAARPVPQAPGFLAAWNIFGALDLLAALGLAITSGPNAPFPVFEAGNAAVVQGLPWSFIPTVLVPFYLIVHAILFVQLRRLQAARPRTSIAGPAHARG